jgi:hypothetical protein
MAKPTKAERSAAAKKAAATRARKKAAKDREKDLRKAAAGTASRADAQSGAADRKTAGEAIDRIRDLNERILAAGQKAGGAYLDAYEQALESILAYEKRAAAQTDMDWISTVIEAQSEFTRGLTKLYVSTGRKVLKG